MIARTPINLLLLLGCSGMMSAQPAPDMHVPSYRDNLTPYPLLAGKFGTDPAFSQAELELLARNFDALYGGSKASLTLQKIDQIYSINTNFQVVHYKNAASTGKISTPLKDIEQSHKNDLLYYLTGNAGSALDDITTALTISNLFGTLVASTADPGRTNGYFTDGVFNYVTWLKIDDELMRIEAITNSTSAKVATVTVTRGFSGSTAAPHTNKAPVVAPAYFIAPTPGMTAGISYFNDPAAVLIRQYLADEAELEYQSKHRGIWIDILGGDFNCITMGGEKMNASHKWDSLKRQIYDPLDWAAHSEAGINHIQTNFFAAHGFHPVIWGNNMGWPVSPGDSEINMLKSTPEKPRPIDGFAQEAEIGSFPAGTTGADYDLWNYSSWANNLRSTMLMEELKVAAVAVIMDAGIQNANFSQLPDATRHQLLLYGYASYLLAVRVQPDDKIYSKFGFTPLVDPGTNTPFLELDPIFLYDIGRPTETRTNTDCLGYRLPGQTVFQRRFENGLVLANPGDNTNFVETVMLDQPYFDPETSNNVTQVQIPAKTGKILLNQVDTLPPAVVITSPTNGAAFLSNSAIPVSAAVTDNVAVAFAELWVNGVLSQILSNAPYNFSVTNLALGLHTLTVRGADWSGNAATDSVTVRVVAQLPYGGLARQIPGLIQAEDYDLGGEGAAYHDTTANNTGGAYRNDGVDVQATTDTGGGCRVGWICSGEWLAYTVNAQPGRYDLQARIATPLTDAADLQLSLDGEPIGTFDVPNTRAWSNWLTLTLPNVPVTAGTNRILRLAVINSSASNQLDLNWVQFVASTNAAFPLVESRAPAADRLVLRWVTVPGWRYQVLCKDDLADALWQPLGDPITATSTNLTITNATSLPMRFYRVRELP